MIGFAKLLHILTTHYLPEIVNTNSMIKNNIYKTTAIIITIILFLLTGADMYIKNYGDISQFKGSESEINQINRLSEYYEKRENEIRLMTYNILADTIGFEGSPAQTRADLVCTTINSIAPDVCAFQETSRKWFACIYNNTRYKFVHPIRTGILSTMTTLAYNPQTVTLLSFGEKVFENGDPSPLRRMVWGAFHHKKTDKTFVVISTHFSISDPQLSDNTTPLSQALEAINLSKQLKNLFDCNLFIMGDFNAKSSTKKTPSPVYDILSTTFLNTKILAKEICNGENTKKSTPSIDHIFCYGNPEITRHVTLSQSIFAQLSDHYPIFCDILIE